MTRQTSDIRVPTLDIGVARGEDCRESIRGRRSTAVGAVSAAMSHALRGDVSVGFVGGERHAPVRKAAQDPRPAADG